MSLGDRLGMAGLLVGVVGTGLALLGPTQKWVGVSLLIVGGLVAIGWSTLEFRSRSMSLLLSVAVGCTIGGLVAGLFWYALKGKPDVPMTASPDAGPSASFDIFEALTSPDLSPKMRSIVHRYIDVKTEVNKARAKLDESFAKLDAKRPGGDGAPPKTPKS